jgi:hypothetical protein
MCFKRHCHHSAAPDLAAGVFPIPGEDYSFRLVDLLILSPNPMVFTFGRAHAKSIRPAFAKIDLARGKGKVFRAEPSAEMFGPSPRRKDDLTRSVENTVYNKFAISRALGRTNGRHFVSTIYLP